MSDYALDASALIAAIRGEPGAERVRAVLNRSSISAINIAETGISLGRHGLPLDAIRTVIGTLPVQIVDFDYRQSIAVWDLRDAINVQGLSLADHICLAFAKVHGLRVLTADRLWAEVEVGVEVELIR